MGAASGSESSGQTGGIGAAQRWYAGRTVLVTGGAGFIGSHLVERLAGLGARVRVLDDLSTGHESNLVGAKGSVEFRRASILDDRALRESAAGCDVVFHEAAMVSAPLSASGSMSRAQPGSWARPRTPAPSGSCLPRPPRPTAARLPIAFRAAKTRPPRPGRPTP